MTNPDTFSSEAALEEELGGVLALAAVGLQHLHCCATEARLRIVDVRIDARMEALAVDRRDEALPAQVLPGRGQHRRDQLLCAPERDPDVAPRLAVVLLVGLLVVGIERFDLVEARERREEVGSVGDLTDRKSTRL